MMLMPFYRYEFGEIKVFHPPFHPQVYGNLKNDVINGPCCLSDNHIPAKTIY